MQLVKNYSAEASADDVQNGSPSVLALVAEDDRMYVMIYCNTISVNWCFSKVCVKREINLTKIKAKMAI